MIFKLPFTWKVPWFQWWTESAIRNCIYGDLLLSSTFHSSFIHSLIHSNLSPSHVPNLVLGLCGKVETLEHWSQCLWGPPKSSFSLPVWCYFLCLSFTIFHTSASLDGLSGLGSFLPHCCLCQKWPPFPKSPSVYIAAVTHVLVHMPRLPHVNPVSKMVVNGPFLNPKSFCPSVVTPRVIFCEVELYEITIFVS